MALKINTHSISSSRNVYVDRLKINYNAQFIKEHVSRCISAADIILMLSG